MIRYKGWEGREGMDAGFLHFSLRKQRSQRCKSKTLEGKESKPAGQS